ncbi:MAG: hypothetical protein A2945_00920 [Candidatus Liptonbacteria bacterium RIFCSPLOWO2_01_FULL_52_25]|uniref:tRNA-specific 2-thiouridylase MnmA n=1 Tax=Candidatus Liptonbacteria bacterium RIFCSPLOWO2_01_FULL_52_25 TaxID=1798650 RepID=A0A1G2CDC8_9BACT|nr:MAG: hypothetical protein A2945_00920 [Candidatus Liptonbacteria bacterium RIFCSPLOWO2_01_FULL_52_25]
MSTNFKLLAQKLPKGYNNPANMSSIKSKKVFVAMSGGVDSSVAAMLLKNAYLDSHGRVRIAEGRRPEARYSRAYDVVGVFMRCWSGDASLDKLGMNCAWERDSEDARRVAEYLHIPFYVWDFEEEYKKRVVGYMIEGYRAGITPNPDVMCNHEIKFGLFFEKACAMGADYIATGHYVRLRQHNANLRVDSNTTNKNSSIRSIRSPFVAFGLYEAVDKNKDQSYFLWTLTQKQLAHCLFPIGNYTKPEVRVMAKQAGLSTADKKDSQGICFLGQVSIADFLKEYIPAKRGEVFTTAGAKIGEHNGAHLYTIGQRHIGVRYQVSGVKGAELRPHYVVEKNAKENTVVVAEGDNHPALYKKEVKLADVNFIDSHHPYILENVRMKVLARVRYRQPLTPATLKGDTLVFEKPQKFVAVGQSAVFYVNDDPSPPFTYSGQIPDGFRMLGGGVIVGDK